MNRLILGITVILTVLLSASILVASDDSDAAVSDNVKVYIELEDGSYDMAVIDGVNKMEDAVKQAADELGLGEIEMLSSGRGIKSVGGRVPLADHYWVVHQWLPHSSDEHTAIPGWGEVSVDGEFDDYLRSGVSLCLHIATIDYENKDAMYTVPDFKPESEGYVFIRFYLNYNDPNPNVQEAFDEETRLAGFWLKGTGSNIGEVLVNAVEENNFEIDCYVGKDGHGNNLQYWINSMFGMGDVLLDDDTWAYWIQLCFIENEWTYNSWTLGYYDPAVYPYVMLVYSTSAAEGDITYDIGEEPDPYEAKDNVISRYNTVTFYVDGEYYDSLTVEWGSPVDFITIEDPYKEGYLFQGWTGCDGLIYRDTRADASFVHRGSTSYTVTYMGDDGRTVIATENVKPGEPAAYTNIPGKADTAQYTYTFRGWSVSVGKYTVADLSSINADTTVYAYFDPVVKTYTVTFMLDGDVYSVDKVEYGSKAVPPTDPSRDPDAQYTYSFKGWSSTSGTFNRAVLDNVVSDMTVYAFFDFTVNTYTVTFCNADGSPYDFRTVAYGSVVTDIPAGPAKASTAQYTYTFVKWDYDRSPVTSDIVVMPIYNETVNRYAVVFYNPDGTMYDSRAVDYGTVLSDLPAGPVKTSTAQYTYTFVKWDYNGEPVVTDLKIMPIYSQKTNSYRVFFTDIDGNVLKDTTVEYGSSVDAPSVPDKVTAQYTYTFRGWDNDGYMNVTGNTEVKAQYTRTVNFYDVTFHDRTGSVISISNVEYGSSVDTPSVPQTEKVGGKTYTFRGWSTSSVELVPANLKTVVSDMDVYAYYAESDTMVTVTFLKDDGTVFDRKTVVYGTDLSRTSGPAKAQDERYIYAFEGWDKDLTHVESDMTVKAVYTAVLRYYIATFVDDSGKVVGTSTAPYGEPANAPEAPVKPSDKVYCYEFAGWDTDFSHMVKDIVVKALYKAAYIEYGIHFIVDGSEYSVKHAHYGESLTDMPADPVRPDTPAYTYPFIGWSVSQDVFTEASFAGITDDMDVYAHFGTEDRKYKVTYHRENGSFYTYQNIGYDMSAVRINPPAKEPTAEFTYEFMGWSVSSKEYIEADLKHVRADMDVYPFYTAVKNTYTVRFLDDDGTFLGSSTVEYGSEAVCPVTPYKEPTAQYTYTFEGWDSDISHIVGDMTVKAVYGSTVNVYTVTFTDDDGTVLKTERIEFGKSATAPADPVKAPTAQYTYEFAGWDVPFTVVTGDLKVTATYKNILNEYLLTFVSEGKTVGSKHMPYGSRSDAVGIPVPTAPAGKKFSAWNGLGTTVTKDMVLTAVFVDDTETLYTVTYLNHDGSTVHTDKVTYGQPSVYSEKPTRASTAQYSFSFRGWSSDKASYISADLTRITEDVTVYAFYDGNIRSYNVTFVDYDGYVLASMAVEYGSSATAPADPYRAPTAEYTYTFKGWDSDYSDIRGDTVVKAVYDRTVNFYEVVFVDFDGSILKKDSVGYGGYAIAPVDPVRERTPEFTYTFVGWSDSDTVFSPADLSSISYDRTVYAWYLSERNSYTVTFVNDDGSVLKTETVMYGQPATAPADPSKEPVAGHTYTFVGWDVPFDMITGDLVVTAVFSDTEILYTVTFMDGNEVLKSEKVTYGSSVTAPAAPHREPTAQYTFGFMGWSLSTTEFVKAETDRITGNITAYAYFEATVNEYTVQFMVDGALYSSCTVPYGSPATVPADPAKEPTAQYTYSFGGWSTVADRNVPADLSSVKSDMTVHAYFESMVNVYTVTFEVEGEVYAVKTLGYGSTVDASGVEDPVPPVGMRFKGWEGVGATVTCDMTVKASFVYDDVTLYNVTYMDGETVLFVDRVTYRTDSVYGEKPVKVPTPEFSYTFRGWSALAEVYTPAVLTGITEDVTVYAWYDEVRNTYTVTFLDDDGTVLSKETVEYGSAAIGPEAPYKEPTAQYTYFFTGWDSDIGCVKENMEVKAVYDAVLNSYTVTFVAGSETVGTKVFDYGMAMSSEGIVTPDAPAGKKFVGWEGEGTPVTGDMTVYALFVDDTETLYTVTYIGADGETVHTESMTYGKPATYSSVPAKEPTAQYTYAFMGWSVSQDEFTEADLSSVTCDVTVYAWFSETVRSYGVSFVDDKGHTFYTCTVLYGQPADVPEAPVKESTVSTVYTFRGWSTLHGEYSEADLSCIVGDTIVYAWYYDEVREYTVTYMSGETLFAVRSVPYNGSVPTDVGTPEAPSGYVFDRWDGSEKTVVSDMTVTAVFSVKEVTFTVVYKNENGTTLWTEIVDAGGSAKYDVVPVKEDTKEHTYTFVGWDHDLTNIHSNLTVYPVFEEKPRMYNVLFFDWDKTLIGQYSVAYGYPVDVPEAPGRDSTVQYVYTFHGWSTMPSQYNPATLDSVTGSMTVYAYYLKSFREYDVEFMDREVSVGHTSVRYQGTVDERLAFTLMEGYGLRFFLDRELTKEAGAGYQILGDTVFYVKKYIGDYTLVGTNVTVSLDDKMVSSVSGTFEIDASQTGSVKNVTMPADTVALLNGVHGGCMVKVTVPRGSMTMTSEELYALSNGSLGTSGGMDITVNISAGRVTAAITKAMGERNYTGVYYVSVNVGSAVVTDLDEKGMTVEVSLPLSLSEGRDDAAVWHIATGNVVENIDCVYRNGLVTFTASSLGNFCIGTVNAPDVKDKVVVPYGDIAVDKDGNLVSLSVDNHGEVLFVPSYHNDVKIISVASGAFKGLENAPMVVLPESVKKFDWSSLDGTSVLEVVFLGNMPEMTGTAPSKVTVYRASTASGWDEYYAEVLDVFTRDFDTCSLVFYVLGDYAVLKSGKNGSNINIPEYIPYNGKNVKVRYIGDSAFANNTYVSQVIIPDSVTDIMTRAFYNSWVKKIVFGDSPSVEHIWDGAFTGCNRLTNISLPDTMLFIGGHAFEGCSLFTRIAMPDGVQVIGEYAFAECTDLQKVSLGSSLLYVSEGCFHGDRQLDSATLPKTVTYIGDRAFEDCISLPSIDIANSVTVGKEAFKGCKVMEYATFGKDLVSLGEDSFKECPKLTEIDAYGAVPAGMDKAFDDPMALEFYVTALHLGEWSVYHAELMESEKTYEEDKGDGMIYVLIAIIVVMVAIGVISLRVRKNMR